MVEKYIELAGEDKQRWKFQRREKKRKKAIEYSQKFKKKDVPKLSKKDEYLVTGYKNDNQDDVFTMTVGAKSYNGEPKWYEEIKAKARKQEKCTKVNILSIDTK